MDASPDFSAAYYYISAIISLLIVFAIPYQYSQFERLLNRRKRNQSQISLDDSREKSEEEEEGLDITPIHSFAKVSFHKIWNSVIHVIGVGDMSVGEIILLLFFISF